MSLSILSCQNGGGNNDFVVAIPKREYQFLGQGAFIIWVIVEGAFVSVLEGDEVSNLSAKGCCQSSMRYDNDKSSIAACAFTLRKI